jgi:hypothetical protein
MTIGLLAIAWMTVRMMARFKKASEELTQLSRMVSESVARFDLGTREARDLVASLRECVPPALRVVGRCDAVSQRAADLSSTILQEFELPILAAAVVARGVRSGANQLLKRLAQRFTHRRPPIHGGYVHE